MLENEKATLHAKEATMKEALDQLRREKDHLEQDLKERLDQEKSEA